MLFIDKALRRTLALCLLSVAAGPPACTQAAPFVLPRNGHCVAYSAGGETVAIGYSGQSNGEFPPGPHPNPAKCGVVEWFDSEGRRLQRIETFGDLTKVAFSRDNKWVAASRLYATADGVPLNTVFVWKVADGTVGHVLDRCHTFVLSPTQERIVVASRTKCVAYELHGGTKLLQYPPLAGAMSLDLSPDGAFIAAAVASGAGYSIRVCDATTGRQLAESSKFEQPFYSSVFSPDGRRIASGHAGRVVLWDAVELLPLQQFRARGDGLQHPFFSPGGESLGSGDQGNGDVAFWDLQTGQPTASYTFERGALQTFHPRRQPGEPAPETAPHRFVFTPDGSAFLSGPHGGIVRRIQNGQDIQRFGR